MNKQDKGIKKKKATYNGNIFVQTFAIVLGRTLPTILISIVKRIPQARLVFYAKEDCYFSEAQDQCPVMCFKKRVLKKYFTF